MLWAPMDAALLQGCVGMVILSCCTTGSHWTFIFALNAKSHWGRYPLPRIDQGKFFEGGVERQGLGGTCWPGDTPHVLPVVTKLMLWVLKHWLGANLAVAWG